MFYLIAGILLAIYYVFVLPRHVKGTLNTLTLFGAIALLSVLVLLAAIRFLQSPPEFFIGLSMLGLAILTWRDIDQLSCPDQKPKKKRKGRLPRFL